MELNSLARTLAERDFISKRTQAMAEAVIREAIEKTQPKWILVSERLPELGQYVLASGPTHSFVLNEEVWYRTTAKYIGEKDFRDGLGNMLSNTHWMPLPEPPAIRSLKQSNSGMEVRTNVQP